MDRCLRDVWCLVFGVWCLVFKRLEKFKKFNKFYFNLLNLLNLLNLFNLLNIFSFYYFLRGKTIREFVATPAILRRSKSKFIFTFVEIIHTKFYPGLKNSFTLFAKHSKYLFLILSIFFANPSKAQHYIQTPSKINEQLLQNSIMGLAKDESGFIWAATQFGCYRYDGFNTKNYISKNTPFLGSNRFRQLLNDKTRNRIIAIGEFDYFIIANRKLQPKEKNDSVLLFSNHNFFFIPKSRCKKFIQSNIDISSYPTRIMSFRSDTLILLDDKWFNITKNIFPEKKIFKLINPDNLVARNGHQYFFNEFGMYELFWQNDKLQTQLITSLKGFQNIIINNSDDNIWMEQDNQIAEINVPACTIGKTINKTDIIKNIYSIQVDKETGVVYLGTSANGIINMKIYKGSIFSPNNYINSYAYNQYLKSYSMIEKTGVALFSNQSKEKIEVLKRASIPYSIFSDNEDRIWFQEVSSKIQLLDTKTNRITDSIENDDILIAVKEIDKDNFYISNHYQLEKYNLSSRVHETYFDIPNGEIINGFSIINSIFYINSSNGLYLIDSNKKLIHHYLNGIAIRKTLQLKNNIIAIGTYGNGLKFLKNNQLISSSSEKYSQLDAVVSLALDADGALWAMCNKAAFVWNQPDKIINNIPPPDHILYVEKELPCSELNGGFCPDVFPNNEIALPSSNGLLVFKKADLIQQKINVQFYIAAVTIDDSTLHGFSDFMVPAGTDNLSFFIDAAFEDQDNNILAEYRIKGLDTNWQAFPNSRTICLQRLPKGNYVLEVRKSPIDNAIVLNRFTVKPFWFETIWFVMGFILTIILLIYLIVKIRLRAQVIQKIKLEGIIKTKTKELEQNIIKLSESEKEVKKQYRYRNKLYSILMHDIRSPLKFLSTYSLQQLEKQRQNNIDKDSLGIIAESSNDLYRFINEFLFWLSNQNNEEILSIKETDISLLLKELVDFYQPVSMINHNKILFFEKSDAILFSTDEERIKIIIRNLLDNANKYTKNGIIKLSAEIDEKNMLVIKIEDSGSGIPSNLKDVINNSSNTSEIDPSINANHKMGLMISKELTGQLKGSISVTSEENVGTVFVLRFGNVV